MKSIITLVLSTLSFIALASTTTGYVNHFVVHHDGDNLHKFDVALDGTAPNQPTECNNGYYSGDLTTEAGKAHYSMLLSAVMANREVKIDGQSSCFHGREKVRNVHIKF